MSSVYIALSVHQVIFGGRNRQKQPPLWSNDENGIFLKMKAGNDKYLLYLFQRVVRRCAGGDLVGTVVR